MDKIILREVEIRIFNTFEKLYPWETGIKNIDYNGYTKGITLKEAKRKVQPNLSVTIA